MKKRLLIDISHILKMDLHVAKGMDSATAVEFEGEMVPIPDPMESYDLFLTSLQKTLKELDMVPNQIILVKDGKNCKEMRRKFLPGYCVRPPSAPEFSEAFRKTLELVETTVLKYGGLSVVKDGFEADDLIAALAEKMPCVIWSGDKDLIAAGDVYFNGQMNEDKFLGIAKKHIAVYKSLVGDNSDKIPGAKGLGQAAFIKMIEQFGEDSLDDMLDMLKNRTLHELEGYVSEFKPFQKILDNIDEVYGSYDCARFHPVGYFGLEWGAAYPSGDGSFPEWEPSMELVTASKLDLSALSREMKAAPWNSLDIETYVTPEGRAWMERNKNRQGKMPLDIRGSKLAGFSITTGRAANRTYYFPVDHADTENLSMAQAEAVLNLLQEDVPTICHNVSFELSVLRCHFDLRFDRGWLPPLLYCTKILSGYVDEYSLSGLKHQSKTRLNYDQVSYESVTTKVGDDGKPYRVDMNQLTGAEVLHYGADDTVCTSALFNLFEVITHYEGSWKCYSEVDVTAVFAYAEKFVNGVPFDQAKRKELQDKRMKEYEEYYAKIQEFLETLEWVDRIERDTTVKPMTLEDLKAAKENGTLNQEQKPDYVEITKKWPGCEFVPASELTPAEIKRLHLECFGVPLECKARKFEKMADAIQDPEFAELVRTENLFGLNYYCEERFVPNPQISLQSPKQLSELMYEALGLPVRVRGKVSDIMRAKGIRQGNPSANESAITHALVYDFPDGGETAEFLKNVLEAKSCLTEDGLFYRPYENFPHWDTGLVHSEFSVASQKSGRGTAKHPNDAQVSKESGIREIYVPYESEDPDDPYLWISCDISSQEILLMAELSQDENMLSCFRGDNKRDVHSITGAAVYNLNHQADPISYEEFFAKRKTDPEVKGIRKDAAKRTNFGVNYDISAKGLALQLLISEERAQAMIDAHAEQFPGVHKWKEDMAKLILEQGYGVDLMGRRRHVGYVLDGSWKDAGEARSAVNSLIQGPGAEQIKLIINKLWKSRVYERYPAYFFGTVHDEILSICRRSAVVDFLREKHAAMIQPFADLVSRFSSTISIGPNFGKQTEVCEFFDEAAIKKFLKEM